MADKQRLFQLIQQLGSAPSANASPDLTPQPSGLASDRCTPDRGRAPFRGGRHSGGGGGSAGCALVLPGLGAGARPAAEAPCYPKGVYAARAGERGRAAWPGLALWPVSLAAGRRRSARARTHRGRGGSGAWRGVSEAGVLPMACTAKGARGGIQSTGPRATRADRLGCIMGAGAGAGPRACAPCPALSLPRAALRSRPQVADRRSRRRQLWVPGPRRGRRRRLP